LNFKGEYQPEGCVEHEEENCHLAARLGILFVLWKGLHWGKRFELKLKRMIKNLHKNNGKGIQLFVEKLTNGLSLAKS
jgi:hypothetical protein